MINTYKFYKKIVLGELFLKNTGNRYRFVNQKTYKKDGEIKGVKLTLRILKDDTDYGVEEDGSPRGNNIGENFEVTILNGKPKADLEKEDVVALIGFREDDSFVFDDGFKLLMRFDDYKKIEIQNNSGKN